MKPADQTLLHGEQPEPGNCMAASIASIFELQIERVPNFAAADNCWDALDAWLRPRGFVSLRIPRGITYARKVYMMTCGPSPRGNGLFHAVVSFRGEIVHDPHPSRAGLADSEGWTDVYFVAIDPARDIRGRSVAKCRQAQ